MSSLRRDIEAMEDLAAALDAIDEILKILALHIRQPQLLEEILLGREKVFFSQQIVWSQREALRRAASED